MRRARGYGQPRRLMAALGAVAVTVLAAGCGTSSSTTTTGGSTRAAAAADGARVCPDKKTGVDVPATVTNNLTIPVTLGFTEIDCVPWSGRTPAFYSGAVVPPGGTVPMPVRVWSNGVPSWRTTLRSEDGQAVLASFRQILVRGRRIGILLGSSYAPTNTVSISGAGRPATARMEQGRNLVLGYTK